MKAITVEPGKSGTARFEDFPEPEIQEGSVLVEAVAVGVCGTDVEIAGVPVGKVASISIREHQAIVMMQIDKGIALPDDTIASVKTRGLIGDVYISLSPGASDRMIPPGGRIRETEAAVDLGGLIGQVIHGSAKE